MLKGKEVLLGISGGISAYKSAELCRMLIKAGANVSVVMTKNATRFITPLTMQTLSQRNVFVDMFPEEPSVALPHISLSEKAQLFLIAPATANLIGKLACGIADDLVSTLALALKKEIPKIICPAMNVNMYENPMVQENLNKLKKLGWIIVEPEQGELACGWEGRGRLAELDVIFQTAYSALSPKDLIEKKVVVSAGPTREAIDSVRFISNRSSGKMGYALAQVAKARGAEVVLVSGPTSLKAPYGVKMIAVESAKEMADACIKEAKDADIIIKSAAVADFTPSEKFSHKIKKSEKGLTLNLKPTMDILKNLGEKKKKGQILVGFAAESENLIENARKKLEEKNLDLIVANDITRKDAGFDSDTNIATLIFRKGKIEKLPKMTKLELSEIIFDKIIQNILKK